MLMPIEEAKKILANAKRSVLADHAFGDKEITWYDDNNHIIANGYDGRTTSVSMEPTDKYEHTVFENTDLVVLGIPYRYKRNDSGSCYSEDDVRDREYYNRFGLKD